jgi:hypothetical protein
MVGRICWVGYIWWIRYMIYMVGRIHVCVDRIHVGTMYVWMG